MSSFPPRKRMDLREFWFRHLLAWQNSDLNQREYCEANDLPLKRFGNWRAELRDEMPPPPKRLLYRRSVAVCHMTDSATNKETGAVSPGYRLPPLDQTQPLRKGFSSADKRNIVAQLKRSGATVASVARRYDISPRTLFRWRQTYAPDPDPVILPVAIVDEEADGAAATCSGPVPVSTPAPAPEVSITLKSGHEMRLPVNTAPETIQALLIQLDGAPS